VRNWSIGQNSQTFPNRFSVKGLLHFRWVIYQMKPLKAGCKHTDARAIASMCSRIILQHSCDYAIEAAV